MGGSSLCPHSGALQSRPPAPLCQAPPRPPAAPGPATTSSTARLRARVSGGAGVSRRACCPTLVQTPAPWVQAPASPAPPATRPTSSATVASVRYAILGSDQGVAGVACGQAAAGKHATACRPHEGAVHARRPCMRGTHLRTCTTWLSQMATVKLRTMSRTPLGCPSGPSAAMMAWSAVEGGSPRRRWRR